MVVLVGYASVGGSTRRVAERIAARITEHGCAVDCRPLDEVKDTTVYDAFVLGSAIHSGAWLPLAADFLRRNVGTLIGRPLWLFSVSSVGEQSIAFAPPIARRLAGGVFMTAMRGRCGDHRNWAEIDAWARDIARQLPGDRNERTSVMT